MANLTFLAGGGETGARMRAMDWDATPLGPVASWPPAIGGRDARFIALSGYGQPGDVAQSMAAGFDRHVVKPADIAQLHAMLCG
jgi:CheY-like chemotaxis protein